MMRRWVCAGRCGDVFCVAYSHDATNWTKPSFDNGFAVCARPRAQARMGGAASADTGTDATGGQGGAGARAASGVSTACNVVLDAPYDGFTVWLDLDATDPSQR